MLKAFLPIEETIENCVNDLFFDKSKIYNLTKQDVYDLFLFLTTVFIIR